MNGTARWFCVIVMAFALLAAGMPVRAAAEEIRVVLGNQELTFDVPPALVNGRVLVPLRKIFETLGAKVAYDDATQRITAWKGPITVELTIGDPAVRIDGEPKKLDVPPQVVNGRTLVPVRFVSEALGGQVAWDPATRTVSIVTPAGTTSPADMVLAPRDLPGGKWTELASPGELPQGWKKVLVSRDPAEPYAWISSALEPVGEGAGAWVQERACRSEETEIDPPGDLLFWNTAKFCQSWDPQGNLVVSTYIAAGEYVLTMAASPRDPQTTVDHPITTLAGLAVHQLILLGKLARGEDRPAPLAAMPAPAAKPTEGQGVQPPAPAPLKFAPPQTALSLPAGKRTNADQEKVIYSFCTPEPESLTSPCGPMPVTSNPTGGNPPYHFVLGTMGGFPPIGVSLLKDGHLVGEPALATAGKTFTFTVCAVDLSANRVCHQVTLSVGQPEIPPLHFAAPALPRAFEDRQYQAALGNPTGGRPPYQFKLRGEGMPAGLRLTPEGMVEGWPAGGTGGKSYTITVCAVDAEAQEACADVALQVDPRPPTLVEQFANTSWSGTFTINFEKFASEPGTLAFKFGPDTGDTRIKVVEATVSFKGWRFKLYDGYLSCINENSCQGVYLDFDFLEEGPGFDRPGDLGWWVRYLRFYVNVEIKSDSAPPRIDDKGITHELTPTSMKGRAEAYSLNPPGTFTVTRR